MFDPVSLSQEFAKKPFQPVRVHLQDGGAYEIPSRFHVVVGVNFLEIGFQAPNRPEGVCAGGVNVLLDEIHALEPFSAAERKVIIVLRNIVQIEFIAPPPPPSAN